MKKKSKIAVVKASGLLAYFDERKLIRSLQRSGADAQLIESILKEIRSRLYDGISTYEIYRMAYSLLRSGGDSFAARYKLKNAIMELGPSGFPFEIYVSELLKRQGYATRVGIVLEGHCVKHEVDVIAEQNHTRHLIECKYHNSRGLVTDVKIPLYIQARFTDLHQRQSIAKENDGITFKGCVVTNTKFSTDAMTYGNCVGLHLIGWDYPVGGSLREMIDSTGLHPITCLTTLTGKEKQQLLDQQIVLCLDIHEQPTLLNTLGIKPARISQILKEAKTLCQSH